jgi:hypothetical protein
MLYNVLKAVCFVVGIVLTSSDGPHMPVGNIVGLIIFLGILLGPYKRRKRSMYD